jgi:HSP20 family protein
MTTNGLLPRRWRAEDSNPFGSITSIERVMDQLMADFAPVFAMPGIGVSPAESTHASWFPQLDIVESENEFTLAAELPGMELADVELSVNEGVLVLKGQKHSQGEEKGRRLHRRERSYGAFERALRLPSDVDVAAIKAVFDKGVLTVTLPRIRPAKPEPTRIEIKPAG